MQEVLSALKEMATTSTKDVRREGGREGKREGGREGGSVPSRGYTVGPP